MRAARLDLATGADMGWGMPTGPPVDARFSRFHCGPVRWSCSESGAEVALFDTLPWGSSVGSLCSSCRSKDFICRSWAAVISTLQPHRQQSAMSSHNRMDIGAPQSGQAHMTELPSSQNFRGVRGSYVTNSGRLGNSLGMDHSSVLEATLLHRSSNPTATTLISI